MRIAEMRQRFIGIVLVIVPPLAFVLKDVVATMAVLSSEPGITARAAAVLPHRNASGHALVWRRTGNVLQFHLRCARRFDYLSVR